VKIEISESEPPIVENDIVQLETSLGIKLPDSYRYFLLKHNGGRPKPDVFAIPDDPIPNQASMVDFFYSICTDSTYDLIETYMVLQGRIPDNMFAIACDPGGNQICLSLSGEDAGKIYFWDHEQEVDDGDIPTYENMYLIADSFDDLINNKLLDGHP
jgi:cell wall assembly regulator SMI1